MAFNILCTRKLLCNVFLGWLYTYREILKIGRKMMKNKKCISEYFAPSFLRFTPFFRILRQGQHLRENSWDFVVYFFAALIKQDIRLKCEKYTESVLHFVMCFTKPFAKYQRNLKYEKRTAGLTEKTRISQAYISASIK